MDDGQLGEAGVPARIDDYRILRRIGAGGIGTVFEAEQDEPRRRVALKILRAEVVSPEVLRRFEQEAEALGSLHHPGVAQIHAVGRFHGPGGALPYIALEYVDGVALTEYADHARLGRRHRLELLAAVCDAVQHAHQQGVIHRDLKPANILVGEDGQPKVLDFSVSHLMRGHKDSEGLTHTGNILGTIAYMSPEQARGDRAIDTRADVYALGVIGYELLGGRPPHAIEDLPLMDALRIVQEQRAPRLDSVDRTLRGDLTIILGKALEPERQRRYASAAAFAEDIRRFLGDHPISARPPTFAYQLSRFIRRNKSLVASALVAASCLVVGLVLALLSQREEARQRAVAERQSVEARRATYAALVQAAMAYRASGDVYSARLRLAAAEPGLRAWEWEYLSASIEDELGFFPMAIRTQPVPTACPDRTHALFAVKAGSLRLFDLAAGTWTDHPVGDLLPCSAALLPGETEALVGGDDGRMHLIDLAGTRAPRFLSATEGGVPRVTLSSDGRHAVAIEAAKDRADLCSVSVLDPATLAVRRRLEVTPAAGVGDVSPDGSLLAVSVRTGDVLVFDIESGVRRHTLKGHRLWVNHIRFSPSGLRLATSGEDDRICIWSMRTGLEEMTLGPTQHRAHTIAFARDEGTLMSGHADGRIRHWDLGTGTCTWTTSGPAGPDPIGRPILETGLSAGGDVAFGISEDGVHARLAREPVPVVLHHGRVAYPYVYDVEFSPTGSHLASASWDGTVRIWDVTTGRHVAVLGCPFQVFWAKYSPDGKRLVICQQQGWSAHQITSWDARTLTKECERRVECNQPQGLFVARCNALLLGVFSELWVVDPVTLETRDVRKMSAGVLSLAISPDGTRVVCGTEDGVCTVLDSRTLAPLLRVEGNPQDMQAVSVSPDGRLLVSAGGGAIRLWDAGSGRELLKITTPESRELFAIRFTKDGRRIATASRHTAIRIWDVESGRELLQLQGHRDYVHDLAFSPDDRILASASGDGTVRLWDTRPLAERVEARDRAIAAEQAVLPDVERLFDELKTREKVVAAIDADPDLDPTAKHAAWNVAIRWQGRG